MFQIAGAHWRAGLALAGALATGLFSGGAAAQISVSGSGSPAYGQAIAVPPGVGGMQPNLSLMYAGGGVNGPVGHGWSLQGISMITRCPATRYTDGKVQGVAFAPSDKLCLDGQRLIQTNASGTATAFPQTDDAKGVAADTWREYRTEKDSYARIRAYGTAGSDAVNGPKYFKVWTKAGQIYEYGTPPSANDATQASILAYGKNVVMVWAVARIGDVVGNYIDFKYENREATWGTKAAGNAGTGREWNIKEIQYAGNLNGQIPRNKVVFRYSDRSSDLSESYQQGSKNVSKRRLDAIDTYVNSSGTGLLDDDPAVTALFVKRVKITYDNGPTTGRSRVVSIAECADKAGTLCMPPARFTYASGTAYRVASTVFNLESSKLASTDSKYGLMVGDFNGDGRTDLLRWAENASETQLLLSNGDGSFTTKTTSLSNSGALNTSDGCVGSSVADVNGDGLVDIIRVFNDLNQSGYSCNQTSRAEYLINKGDGTFETRQLLDANGSQIPFKRAYSYIDNAEYCGTPGTPPWTGGLCNDTPRTGYGWSDGATYYFMDVNGDGRLDIITSQVPGRRPADPMEDLYDVTKLPNCPGCTQVYLAQPDGRFALTPSNVDNVPLYSDPGRFGAINSWSFVRDTDGDGLADLFSAGMPQNLHTWISDGQGNFTDQGYAGDAYCNTTLDYNGDGRADCLKAAAKANDNSMSVGYATSQTASVANFNLHGTGQELSSDNKKPIGQNFGVYAIDVNGDGRDDLIRWHDDPTKNKLYLSTGDGLFTEAVIGATLGQMGPMNLSKSDGSFDLVMGDFRGRGAVEFLRVARNAPSESDMSKRNKLFVLSDDAGADRLVSYVSPSGLKTVVNYGPMAADGRVLNDATTTDKASYPLMDLALPGQIVISVDQEVGVGSKTVRTEYGYVGMKAAVDGRGMLGFRRTVQQNVAPNGDRLSVWTDFLLDEPYAGVAKRTQTRRGAWNEPNASLLSQTENIYCDQAATANVDAATVDTPCGGSGKITRPYLRQSVEQGWDLNGTALPTVTTVNTYNDYGDPTRIVVSTTGTVTGIAGQTSTKVTENSYCAPDTADCANRISGDNWILGRLSRAKVTNTVPKLIDQLAGSVTPPTQNPGAGTPPTNPAVLQAILMLLVDD